MFNKFIFACLCVPVISISAFAGAQCKNNKEQPNYSWEFDERDNNRPSVSSFLSEIFTPKLVIDIRCIRDYIMDERFQVLRNYYGDIRSIDAIYLKSLRISNHNVARALFLSFIAVLEHRHFKINAPIINSVFLPLTLEKDSIFNRRINHLPSRIYPDTLLNPGGDIDKLQHFFGSAYITYTSEAPELAQAIGNFIEWGEAKFIVDGFDDPRDKRANKQGESFGRDLMSIETLLPSDYLTFSYEGIK